MANNIAEAKTDTERREHLKTRFDPMLEIAWSLPMTIAWIVWRDIDEVRNQWNEYRSRKNRPSATLLEMVLIDLDDSEIDRPKEMNVITAQKILLQELSNTNIKAIAINPNGEIEPISADKWALLEPDTSQIDVDQLRILGQVESAYTEVRFPRAEILNIWPENSQSKEMLPDNTYSASSGAQLPTKPEIIAAKIAELLPTEKDWSGLAKGRIESKVRKDLPSFEFSARSFDSGYALWIKNRPKS
ncbi:MAG: hypothetical protein GY761_08995 [Hyphomicrobiales bacterium]|nr:hypothetical protein [Hyphomicrobiales bacterium]